MLKELLHKEYQFFLKLHPLSRRFLLTTVFFGMALPMLGTFVSAFLWERSHSAEGITLYYLAWYIGCLFAYRLSAWLSAWMPIAAVYSLGLALEGISTTLLFLVDSFNPLWFVSAGTVLGICCGFYWAGKNFLLLVITNNEDRYYYCNLDLVAQTILSVVMPSIFGCFLGFAEHVLPSISEERYLASVLFADLLLFAGAFLAAKSGFPRHQNLHIRAPRESPRWRRLELISFWLGIWNGCVIFFPHMLLLSFFKGEEHLGFAQSTGSLLCSFIMFFFAKSSSPRVQRQVYAFGTFTLILGCGIFAVFFEKYSSAIFYITQTLCFPLIWAYLSPLMLRGFEEGHASREVQYAFIFYREVYLCAGRTFGFCLAFIGFNALTPEISLRCLPFLLSLSLIFCYTLSKKLSPHTP